MKNLRLYVSMLVLLIGITSNTYSQLRLFSTTTATTFQNSDLYHLGNVLLGDNNSGNILGDLTIWKDLSSTANLGIGNSAGKLFIAVAHNNGAFAPIATAGDVVFKKNGEGHMIFNLSTNGSSSNGGRKIYFGDESDAKILVVSNEGRVGIGTDNFDGDDYKLYVKDGIKAEEVKVELCSGWCDYVFKPSYKLQSLEKVEAHIKTYGHLHNMPSEKELEADGGFKLGEMTTMQQEKIEEVFLHLINLNKRLESLEKENQQLKALLMNKQASVETAGK